MKSLVTLLCLAFLAAGPLCVVHAGVPVGQPAPDFQLTDLSGQTHRLSDYKGKIVVLEWTNPECPIVKKHYLSGNIPKLQRDATADGVVWLSINSGHPGSEGDYDKAAVDAWLKQTSAAPTDYFRDSDGKVGHTYGARTTPHMFIISPSGILVYEGAIDSIPSADQADIAHADNYVRSALQSLKAGLPIAVSTSRPYGCSVKY